MRSLLALIALAMSPAVTADDKEAVDPAELAIQVLNEGVASLGPDDILAWVDLPRSVRKGAKFDLTITVENARDADDFTLESIDLDWSFLKGFKIETVSPNPTEVDDSFGTLTLEYPVIIGPDAEAEFTIGMVAVEPGVYIGEATVWHEEEFLYRHVQCKVVE